MHARRMPLLWQQCLLDPGLQANRARAERVSGTLMAGYNVLFNYGHVVWVHGALFLANTDGVCAHQESQYIAQDCPCHCSGLLMSFLHTCVPDIMRSDGGPLPCTEACHAAGLQARGGFIFVCMLLLVFLCVMKGLLLPPCSVQCSSACTQVFCKSMAMVMLLWWVRFLVCRPLLRRGCSWSVLLEVLAVCGWCMPIKAPWYAAMFSRCGSNTGSQHMCCFLNSIAVCPWE